MNRETNIRRIRTVNTALGNLKDKFVFVGGATVSLYADRMTEEMRPTDDVDILVEVWSRWDYAAMEEKLRQAGFQNDIEAKFLGRYIIHGVTVDLMPISGDILGFTNIWYAEGFKQAIEFNIDNDNTVKIFSPPYFIASKLEAFKNRGGSDGRTSSDFEDIIFVFENRNSIWNEMKESEKLVKANLQKEFSRFFENPYFEEWIDVHTSFSSPSSTHYILAALNKFISED